MEDVDKEVLQAWEMLKEWSSQVLVIDPQGDNSIAFRVPGLDGFDLLRELLWRLRIGQPLSIDLPMLIHDAIGSVECPAIV